jgi:hypothetical protein
MAHEPLRLPRSGWARFEADFFYRPDTLRFEARWDDPERPSGSPALPDEKLDG